ncbi:transposase [Aureliella helgolandensis]|uniref:Transposase IS200 like protein n=1 Tax=Aureliella helgolandensis TaxID=2527968 RepID=A0A518GCS7_9BACT|nr:transposase [Aureliella helgolandensis]QDV26402.1 Transposase IS200 like protein [Aureliella helgolandensis]
MDPIYSADNTTTAYQLNWSLALFGKAALPDSSLWLIDLSAATEKDGVRILSANSRSENVIQFLISTRPESSPSDCVRSVKGRLQYLIRDHNPKAFRRNYHIHSVGETTSSALDEYVARQTAKHPMADPKVQARLEANQFLDPEIDLSKCIATTRFAGRVASINEDTEIRHSSE